MRDLPAVAIIRSVYDQELAAMRAEVLEDRWNGRTAADRAADRLGLSADRVREVVR